MRAFATKAAPAVAASFLVQRCSCGSGAKAAGEMCEDCREKEGLGVQPKLIVGAADDPYEREADAAARAVIEAAAPQVSAGPVARISRRALPSAGGTQAAPSSVARAIEGAGEPLGQTERAFFEPRFGHDFGSVRVHRDAAAAASAQDIAARAYTVGHHVVFGAGSYVPASREGRNLIAHELAHVVQQSGAVQRHSVSPLPVGHSNTGEEEEQQPQAAPVAEEEEQGGFGGIVQRFPRGEMFGDEPGWDEKNEAAEIRAEMKESEDCVKNTPPDPVECDPTRTLTWPDFAGAPVMSSGFGAVCHSGLTKRAANTALLKCMPKTSAAQNANPSAIQAVFDGAQSWVKPRSRTPTNNAVNGCRVVINQCRSDITAGGAGTTWALNTGASPVCAASPSPRGDAATSAAECETVVGKDCADQAAADSARLLRHENGHFNLSCAMARKANAMITKTTDVGKLLAAAKTVLSTQQGLYDSQTAHGCDAGQQATWETAISGGLPAVTITVP